MTAPPKYVAFKGNNNLYLSAAPRDGKTVLMFVAASPHDPKAKNTVTVIPNPNPIDKTITVRIMSDSAKYWKRDSTTNAILPDRVEPNDDKDMLFVWKESGPGVVTLLNKGNGLYCARDTTNHCLSAFTSDVEVPEALLVWEKVEP